MVRETERLTFQGLSEGLSVWYVGSGILDPYTQTLLNPNSRWVAASGIISILMEGDALLGMSGKVQVGDFVAKFVYDDIGAFTDTPRIRRDSTGEVFSVEARVLTGLGPSFTRMELALKKKQNE